MQLNIMTQYFAIVLLVVLMCFYATRRKLPLRTGRVFVEIWTVTFLCRILDITSLVTIYCRSTLPLWLVNGLAKAYVCCLIWEVIFFGIYVCADSLNNEKYRLFRSLFLSAGFVSAAAIFSFSIRIHSTGPFDTFTYGPAITVTYIFMSIIVTTVMGITVFNRKRINRNRQQAIYIWFALWLTVAIIQSFNNALLLSSLAASISVMILYIKIENPDIMINTESGLFNEQAFLLYLNQLISQKKEYYMLVLSQRRERTETFSATERKEVDIEIVDFLQKIPNATVFRLSSNRIVLLFSEKEDLYSAHNITSIRFSRGWKEINGQEKKIKMSYFYLDEPFIMDFAEDYLNLFQYAASLRKKFVHLTLESVKKLYGERVTEDMIIKAIDDNRVEVFFQPIFSTKKQRFISAEALTRIINEDGSIVMPGDFIDIAEKSGLIIKLGEVIFRQVCQFIKENNIRSLGLEYIEVNLSTVEGCLENLCEKYYSIMKEYDVSPELINLEITETASIEEKTQLISNMNALRKKGARFSLDDFGTGQSNLNYIIDMPVDIVKFDHVLTQAYFANDKAKFVMDAAINMIHGLELHIVAEGVETKEQLDRLSELGISYIQGFYFSKALPKADFVRFLENASA